MNSYVLDSFALLAYVRKEPHGHIVRQLILEGIQRQAIVSMCIVNVGEVYYTLHKKDTPAKAKILWRNIPRLGIMLYPADEARTLAAAQLKAIYSTSKNQLSYADCFAAALAQELKAALITGDPEFQILANVLPIQFLAE